MKLSDIPPSKCLELVWGIIDRYKAAKDRWPLGKSVKTQVYLTIDDARVMWAAGQWLKRYNDWADEASKSGGKIGIWPADTSLSFSAKWLAEKVAEIDKDEPIISFTARDMKIVESVALHLDHYSLMTAMKEKPKGNWKRK